MDRLKLNDHPNPWKEIWNLNDKVCCIHCGYKDLYDALVHKVKEDTPESFTCYSRKCKNNGSTDFRKILRHFR